MVMSMPKATVSERQPELAVVMDELSAAVCALRQATESLVERISPLSRPGSMVEGGRDMPESCTPVTKGLRLYINDLYFITDILNSAYARVEI